MKKAPVLFLFLLAVMLPLQADLFFSEYIEGSSNNKSVEIYNPGPGAVDLGEYAVWRASNGAAWTAAGVIPLSGTLNEGDVYVVSNSSSVAAILAVTDLASGSCSWNGDDAVGLVHNDVLIDAVGEGGFDPGSYWAVAGIANGTQNHTLVRKASVITGNMDWAASAGTDAEDSEWIVYPSDTFDYLGSHGEGGDVFSVTNVSRVPYLPTADEGITITAEVSGGVEPLTVMWVYTSGGRPLQSVPMQDMGSGVFQLVAPPAWDGMYLEYYVEATDSSARETVVSDTYTFFWGTAPIMSVREVDANGFPLYNGVPCRVQGVATCDDDAFGTYTSAYLQDDTGGLNVYNASLVGMNMGDEYEVYGTIGQYNGLLQLNYEGMAYVDSPGLPDPQTIDLATLIASPEDYEGKLVRIEGVSLDGGVWPGEGSNANIDIDDGSGPIVTMRIDSDTDIDGSPEPAWPIVITGIIGQYDSSSPYDSGYQLTPRSLGDFEAVPAASVTQTVTPGAPGIISFLPSMTAVQINFTDVMMGGDLTVQITNADPSGTDGIADTNIFNYFWTIVTDYVELGAGGATIIIDLDTLPGNGGVTPGQEQPGDLNVYTRSGAMGTWQLVTHVYNGFENTIEITVDHFSEFVFANNTDPLPVELSSFSAIVTTSQTVMLEWVTQSESNMIGYHVLRSDNSEIAQAQYLTDDVIPAYNLTTESTYSLEDSDVDLGSTYYYWLEGVDNDGATDRFGPVMASVSPETPEDPPAFYEVNALQGNYPNPFNPTTDIKFSIRGTEGELVDVELAIFNVRGQRVRTLLDGPVEPGVDIVKSWNGHDDNGVSVSSGVYFYKLTAPGYTEMRKMMLLK